MNIPVRFRDFLWSSHAIGDGRPASGLRRPVDRCSCGIAIEGRLGQAYNEEAFRYLLAVERKRAERSGRPFLLLLVTLQGQGGVGVRIDARVASGLFSGLCLRLRETDLIGWYHEGRVAGALLTELGEAARGDVARLIEERIRGVLGDRLPWNVARRLDVRVHQRPERRYESGHLSFAGDLS